MIGYRRRPPRPLAGVGRVRGSVEGATTSTPSGPGPCAGFCFRGDDEQTLPWSLPLPFPSRSGRGDLLCRIELGPYVKCGRRWGVFAPKG
jgi:hypothetical protein